MVAAADQLPPHDHHHCRRRRHSHAVTVAPAISPRAGIGIAAPPPSFATAPPPSRRRRGDNAALLFLALALAAAASAIARPPAVAAALSLSVGDRGLGGRAGGPRFRRFPSSRITPHNPVAAVHSSTLAAMSSTDGGDGGAAPPTPTGDDDGTVRDVGPCCSEAARAHFRDKSVLLTGASGGLGRALALLLCRDCAPCRLILSGRDVAAVGAVADECRRLATSMVDDDDSSAGGDGTGGAAGTAGVGGGGTEVHVIPCDLSQMDQVGDLAAGALEFAGGKIDVLMNNGGMSSRSRFVDTSVDVDELVMRVNFLSGAALAKAVVPGMIAGGGGGAVVWIGSVQGLVGIPNRSSYAASKFAVQGYCEALRAELAGDGVNVCVVSPGYIRTNLSKSAVLGDGRAYGKMDPATAGGADPYDVARVVLDSVASGRSDVIVAAGPSARAAIWLRFLMPSVLERLLVSRYEKSQKEGHRED